MNNSRIFAPIEQNKDANNGSRNTGGLRTKIHSSNFNTQLFQQQNQRETAKFGGSGQQATANFSLPKAGARLSQPANAAGGEKTIE